MEQLIVRKIISVESSCIDYIVFEKGNITAPVTLMTEDQLNVLQDSIVKAKASKEIEDVV
jgi:hypothetical protein